MQSNIILIREARTRERYLKNTKESPATNFFEETKVLHPVVSKCLRGWPVIIKTKTDDF